MTTFMWIEQIFPMQEHLFMGACILIASVWFDKLLGEVPHFHPLVGFGKWAVFIEKYCRLLPLLSLKQKGIVAWCLSVLPLVFTCFWGLSQLLVFSFWLWAVANILIVYFTLGGK